MDGRGKRFKYSFWDNICFMFGNMWKWDAKGSVLSVLRAPFVVIIQFLGIYLSRTVIMLVESGAHPNHIAMSIASICTAMAGCSVIIAYLNGQNKRMEFLSFNRYQIMIYKYMMTHDYEYNESPKGLSDALKATQNCFGSDSASSKAMDTASSFIGNIIGLLAYAAAIATISPVILIVICVTTIASYYLLKRTTEWTHKNKDSWLPIDRKREYLIRTSKDLEPAKDIRLYNMAGWLRSVLGDVLSQRMDWKRKEETYTFAMHMLCTVLSLIREGTAYGLLAYMMFVKNSSVADFVLYFGIIGGFTAWFDGLVDNLHWFNRINVGFNEMREYLEHENKSNIGKGVKLPAEAFSIEFQNVDYTFIGTETEILKNFNFTIRKGERLAIVGLNGAGKTTLVKLLCGLYRPTRGKILANGIPIDEYNTSEYYSLFSAVFQDITILPMTVGQNIACKMDGIDNQRLAYALLLSGFDKVASKLCNGTGTYLLKGIYADAVDLSGGEIQKLALARAIYSDGRFLILDEPTAALDPIAESNIYQMYNDISKEKTSVFISHRLASTRFCDRIIFLENGSIAEEGTHDELMAKRGKYFNLFEVQSHYYRKDAAI